MLGAIRWIWPSECSVHDNIFKKKEHSILTSMVSELTIKRSSLFYSDRIPVLNTVSTRTHAEMLKKKNVEKKRYLFRNANAVQNICDETKIKLNPHGVCVWLVVYPIRMWNQFTQSLWLVLLLVLNLHLRTNGNRGKIVLEKRERKKKIPSQCIFHSSQNECKNKKKPLWKSESEKVLDCWQIISQSI